MRFEFDPAKSEQERGLPFAAAVQLFDSIRLEWEDRRKDHGEVRYTTLGEIEGRTFCTSFTRRGEAIRVISFRKANARETRRYREHLHERGAQGED